MRSMYFQQTVLDFPLCSANSSDIRIRKLSRDRVLSTSEAFDRRRKPCVSISNVEIVAPDEFAV